MPTAGVDTSMPDRLVDSLLKLFPADRRHHFAPQIEADLYHPDSHIAVALFAIVRDALYSRAISPGPYILAVSIVLAAIVVVAAGMFTLRGAYRLLPPSIDADTQLYALLFTAVFLVLISVLFLAINWLQKCSKSKV